MLVLFIYLKVKIILLLYQSPKPKHLTMNGKAIDIFKINDGKWGIINLNNMIPTPIECLTEVLPLIKDKQYKDLLENQTTYLNDNKSKFLTKVQQFQLQYTKDYLSDRIKERCCNFKLLEEKCIEYSKNKEERYIENTDHNIEDDVDFCFMYISGG